MESRGLKPATVHARVSRVSAFFRWLMNDPQLSAFVKINPAAQARPHYHRPYQSEATKALSDDEMNALLSVVRNLAELGSVVGKRDYALLLLYFLTGLRKERGDRAAREGLGDQRQRGRHQIPEEGREIHGP